MGWKLVVLTGFLAIAGAIIVASWKPWESSSGSNLNNLPVGTRITSYATCIKSEQTDFSLGPSVADNVCRTMGWTP